MAKATLAEYLSYLRDDEWPAGDWIDDSLIEVTQGGVKHEIGDADDCDDMELERRFRPSATVRILAGVVLRESDSSHEATYAKHFEAWRRARSTETIVVSVPKDEAPRIRALLADIQGVKVA